MADDSTYPHLLQAVGFGAQPAPQMGGMDQSAAPGGGGPAAPGGEQYGQYAQQAGFAGAQGASQIEAVKRKLAAAKATLALKGEAERTGINTGMEDRGFFNSGQRLVGIAKQQGAEASQAGELEAGAAEDITNIQGSVAQQMAENKIREEQQSQQNELFKSQQALAPIQQQLAEQQLLNSQKQFELEMKLKQQELENAKKAAQGNYT